VAERCSRPDDTVHALGVREEARDLARYNIRVNTAALAGPQAR
jgi:hypothetical protein